MFNSLGYVKNESYIIYNLVYVVFKSAKAHFIEQWK